MFGATNDSVNISEYVFTPATISLEEPFIQPYDNLNSEESQKIIEEIENEVN